MSRRLAKVSFSLQELEDALRMKPGHKVEWVYTDRLYETKGIEVVVCGPNVPVLLDGLQAPIIDKMLVCNHGKDAS